MYFVVIKNVIFNAKIVLPHSRGYIVQSVHDILYFEACKDNSVMHLIGKNKITVSLSLGQIQEQYRQYPFLRVHHSFLINAYNIEELDLSNCRIILNGKKEHTIARRRKAKICRELFRLFNEFGTIFKIR